MLVHDGLSKYTIRSIAKMQNLQVTKLLILCKLVLSASIKLFSNLLTFWSCWRNIPITSSSFTPKSNYKNNFYEKFDHKNFRQVFVYHNVSVFFIVRRKRSLFSK
jgi:hypothetical protein